MSNLSISVMTIGIIGSGSIGSAIARALAKAGIEATIANSRGPASLEALARELGPAIKAGTREQAASADIVLVAVPWSKIPSALAGLPDWNGRIVIDANNPIEAPLFKPADLKGRASSEVFSDLVPGARVVKAFNHLLPALVSGDPRAEGGRRVMFYSGDDAKAKAEVGALIDRLGSSALTSARWRSEPGWSSSPAARCPRSTSSSSATVAELIAHRRGAAAPFQNPEIGDSDFSMTKLADPS